MVTPPMTYLSDRKKRNNGGEKRGPWSGERRHTEVLYGRGRSEGTQSPSLGEMKKHGTEPVT